MCQFQDALLKNKFLMEITDKLKSECRENALGKTAAMCQGLNEQNIWVLNKKFQLDHQRYQLGGQDLSCVAWKVYITIKCCAPEVRCRYWNTFKIRMFGQGVRQAQEMFLWMEIWSFWPDSGSLIAEPHYLRKMTVFSVTKLKVFWQCIKVLLERRLKKLKKAMA